MHRSVAGTGHRSRDCGLGGSSGGCRHCASRGPERPCAGADSSSGGANLHRLRGRVTGRGGAGAWARGCGLGPGLRAGVAAGRGLGPGLRAPPRGANVHPSRGFAPGEGAESGTGAATVHPVWGFAPGAGAGGPRFDRLRPRNGCIPPNRVQSCPAYRPVPPPPGAYPRTGCTPPRAPTACEREPGAACPIPARPHRVQTPNRVHSRPARPDNHAPQVQTPDRCTPAPRTTLPRADVPRCRRPRQPVQLDPPGTGAGRGPLAARTPPAVTGAHHTPIAMLPDRAPACPRYRAPSERNSSWAASSSQSTAAWPLT